MKKLLKIVGILAGLSILTMIVLAMLIPWMDRWGATDNEVTASYSGDELVPSPRILYTRAISINAAPEDIYPWIVQLGALKGGMYSYEWLETNILRCELINADRIHEEWQDLKVGDKVKMCPEDNWGPPAYEVAMLEPDHVIVLGHQYSSPVDQENGTWSDVWQFVLASQADGTTHLILRSRDVKEGLIWDLFRPGEFIMVRGMLLGIKERAEGMAGR